jgi:hypothetical protein
MPCQNINVLKISVSKGFAVIILSGYGQYRAWNQTEENVKGKNNIKSAAQTRDRGHDFP